MGVFHVIHADPTGKKIKNEFTVRNQIATECGETIMLRLFEPSCNAYGDGTIFAIYLSGTFGRGTYGVRDYATSGFGQDVGAEIGLPGNTSEGDPVTTTGWWFKFNEYAPAGVDPEVSPSNTLMTEGTSTPAVGESLPIDNFKLPPLTTVVRVKASNVNAGLVNYAWRAVDSGASLNGIMATLRPDGGVGSADLLGRPPRGVVMFGADFPTPVAMAIDDVLLVNYQIMIRQWR